MTYLDSRKAELTNDQVRFVQVCLQTFHEHNDGIVKVQLRFPRPKVKAVAKERHRALDPLGSHEGVTNPESLDELVALATEAEVFQQIESMPVERLKLIARQNAVEADSDALLRERLVERVMTLRQIERIVTAKKPAHLEELNPDSQTTSVDKQFGS